MMKRLLLLFILISSLILNAQAPIQEFNFNNTMSSVSKTASFVGIGKYVNDRAGVANSAQKLNSEYFAATITNLPQGNSPRTVSIWVKYNDLSVANYLWGYGSPSNGQFFGLLQQSTTTTKSDLNLAGWGPANDIITTTHVSVNTWYNYVITYDGTTSRIYRNGELIKNAISGKRMTSGTIFYIGKMSSAVGINADVDDIKIYDFALNIEQITALYNEKPILVSNEVINTTKSVKPVKGAKTTNVIINAPLDAKSVKSVEVFSTQGQKVISSSNKALDITKLPEGTYLLRVSSSTETTTTEKLTAK